MAFADLGHVDHQDSLWKNFKHLSAIVDAGDDRHLAFVCSWSAIGFQAEGRAGFLLHGGFLYPSRSLSLS